MTYFLKDLRDADEADIFISFPEFDDESVEWDIPDREIIGHIPVEVCVIKDMKRQNFIERITIPYEEIMKLDRVQNDLSLLMDLNNLRENFLDDMRIQAEDSGEIVRHICRETGCDYYTGNRKLIEKLELPQG